MQKITPCLWFDKNCEEAVDFYVETFPNSKIKSVTRYPDGMRVGPEQPGMEGKILTTVFELDGYAFQALDGGPFFKTNPSISFMVNFDPSKDPEAASNLDKLWEKLSEGGKVLMPLEAYPFSKRYGWVEDRFGISWQLILTDPEGEPRPSIIPSLLFVGSVCGKAEEALNHYVSIFKNSPASSSGQTKMGTVAKYPAGMEPNKEGTAMFAEASLSGEWITAMDSALEHNFAFSEGISMSVECKDQEEVDYFWKKLSEGGEESQCGWVKDKYGVSWQVVPKRLGQLLGNLNSEGSKRVFDAMLGMQKLNVAKLEAAYADK